MASSIAGSTTNQTAVTVRPPSPTLFKDNNKPPPPNGLVAVPSHVSVATAIYGQEKNERDASPSAQFVASLNHRYRPDHWELFRRYHRKLSEDEEPTSLRSGTVLTLLDVLPENEAGTAQGSTTTLETDTTAKLSKMQLRGKTKFTDEWKAQELHSSRNSQKLGTPTRQFRTIIAENVSPEAIMFLWSSLNLDPQAYSEYLTGSMRTFPEVKASSWKIPQLRKRHLTLRWSRLVILRPHGFAVEKRLREAALMKFSESIDKSELGSYIYRKSSRFSLHDPTQFGEYLSDYPAIKDPGKYDINTDDTVRAWDEQATICWAEEKQGIPSYPTVLICTDPIPHSAGTPEYRENLEKLKSVPSDTKYGAPYCYGRRDVDGLGWRGSWDPVLQGREKDESKLQELENELLNTTPSTGQTIQHWMDQYYTSQEEETGNFNAPEDIALVFLLKVVYRDSLQLLTVMSEELRGLNGKMHRPDDVGKHLDSWLRILAIYREELQKVSIVTETALEALYEIATVEQPQHRSFSNKILGNLLTADSVPKDSHPLLHKCFNEFLLLQSQVQSLRTAIQDTSSNLTSNMSIIESRKAIQEAESVTKLTELAFFFVPLGFAASLFGMQIQEFGDAVPIRTFLLTAVVAVVGSYIMRLAVRSKSIESFAEKFGSTIREREQLSESASIPTRAVFKFFLFVLVVIFGFLIAHVVFLIYAVCWQVPYSLVRAILEFSWEVLVERIKHIPLTYKHIMGGLLKGMENWYKEEARKRLLKLEE